MHPRSAGCRDDTANEARRCASLRPSLTAAAAIVAACTTLAACAARPDASPPDAALEDIYVLRSIREQQAPTADWCASSRTGFEPFPTDAERFFSFWSVRSRPRTGGSSTRSRHASPNCAAASARPSDRARQNFYAEIQLGAISFRGQRRVPRPRDRFPRARPLPGPLSARPERPAGAVCRRASDDQYDDEQGRLRRRHGPARIHPGVDRHDPPVEGEIDQLR